jgi:nitrate reductase gamma subunit
MLSFFVGNVMPFITVAVFLGGIAWRIRRWVKGARPKLTLFPAADSKRKVWEDVFKEVLAFKSLFTANRSLWAGTWVFHAGLALILVGHARVVTDFPVLWAALGMETAQADLMGFVLGGGAGVIVLAMGLYLLARRLLVRSVSEISSTEDFLILGLMLAVVLSGDALRFLTHFDLNQSREFFRGLVTLKAAPAPSHPLFLLHFFLGQTLLLIVPFSKFLHIPGIFFSRPLILQQ